MQKITNQQTKHISAILVFVDWPWARVLFWCLAAAAAKSLQSCPTLCNPTDGSPPGSAAPGILQARTLEWVAISFSNAWKWNVKVKSLSRVQLLATPWTAAYQAPPSMGFSRQEYWSGVPLPSPWCLARLSYNSALTYLHFHGAQLSTRNTRPLKSFPSMHQAPSITLDSLGSSLSKLLFPEMSLFSSSSFLSFLVCLLLVLSAVSWPDGLQVVFMSLNF